MSRKIPLCLIFVIAASLTALAIQKNVLLIGLDTAKPVVLVVGGVERPLGDVGPGGDITIALDPNLDAALDPNKNYAVYRTSCNRYVIVVQNSDDEKRCRRDNEKPKADESCGRCVPVGFILKGRYTTVAGAAASAAAAAGSGGLSVEMFFLGGWERTAFPDIDEAEGTIAGRYNASGYNQFSTAVDRRDNGFGAGAGVRVMVGKIGLLGAYSYQDVGGGEVHTMGTRVLNNLAFQLDSTFSVEAHKIILGVPIGTQRFLVIPYYGRAFWNLDRTIIDSLRAGGAQVRGGTTPYGADGSDHVFGARAEAYLHKFAGVFAEVERINFRNVFEADGPDALPVHLNNTNINVGVVVRLPVRR